MCFRFTKTILVGGVTPAPLSRAHREAIAWPDLDWTSRTVVRAPSGCV